MTAEVKGMLNDGTFVADICGVLIFADKDGLNYTRKCVKMIKMVCL